MPKATLDNLDKVLIKCVDISEFLSCFTEDLKIEGLHKTGKSTKILRQDIFYGLITYDPVRFVGINKLRHESADFKWN